MVLKKIIQTMKNALLDDEQFYYAGLEGFIPVEKIKQAHYISIASANWLASASLIATKIKEGLFIDIGSTTTDILLVANHKVQVIGMTDYERMRSDELVYTGIVRTAVMAVAQSALFKGQNMGLMAEYFATMADVYRLTGELNEAHDQTETADGAEKTELASAKRLSRMVGYDFSEDDLALWQQFAQTIKIQQKAKIEYACERQLSRRLVSDEVIFIGAGVGRFLVKQIASNLGYTYQDFSAFFVPGLVGSEMDLADCAPAVSVALLYSATS
jgi:probable H4MPT-linked C1 transfer pathway protein